jgi:hypothetical protein
MSTESTFDLMPDFVACGASLYSPVEAYSTKNPALITARRERCEQSVVYGKPFWSVRDGIDAVFETKVNFRNDGLGELVNYLAHICKDMPNLVSKGVFIWDTGFMLVSVRQGLVQRIVKSSWIAAGSKKLFIDFIRPALDNAPVPWKLAIESICHFKELTLVDHGFLGRGGSGVVFTVTKRPVSDSDEAKGGLARDQTFALKVVVGAENCEKLHLEYDIIRTRTQDAAVDLPIVSLLDDVGHIPPAAVGLCCIDNIFDGYTSRSAVCAAAYLMQSVGHRAPSDGRLQREAIVRALYCLHKNKILHGDARLPNIIEGSDGRLMWIDFMASHIATSPVEYKNDIKLLLKSMYALEDHSFSEALLKAINVYAEKMTDDAVTKLIQTVERKC